MSVVARSPCEVGINLLLSPNWISGDTAWTDSGCISCRKKKRFSVWPRCDLNGIYIKCVTTLSNTWLVVSAPSAVEGRLMKDWWWQPVTWALPELCLAGWSAHIHAGNWLNCGLMDPELGTCACLWSGWTGKLFGWGGKLAAYDGGTLGCEEFMWDWAKDEFCWASCRFEKEAPKTSIKLM